MPNYIYKAIDPSGKTIKGMLNAPSEHALEQRLSEQELVLLHTRRKQPRRFLQPKQITHKELMVFCTQLEQLLRAGVTLPDAIIDLRESSTKSNMRDVLSEIYESLRGGSVFSEALAKRSDIFDDIFVGLIQAGEKTGELPDALSHLVAHIKWNMTLRNRTTRALAYPFFLLLVMLAVITVLMVMVVPQLLDFLTSQNLEPNIQTKLLMFFSNLFVEHWRWLLFVPIVTASIVYLLYKTSSGFRYFMSSTALKLPFIGTIIQKINIARFVHFFSVTYTSGISVLESLATARNVVGNAVIQDAIAFVARQVADGSSITNALELTGRFPNLVTRMFRIGEETGNMEGALENVTYFYDQEVEDSVNSMIGMIQPVMTIILGAIMLWITFVLLGNIYSSVNQMGI